MVEEVVGMAWASTVEAVISLVAVAISLGIVLPAIASQNIKERTLRGDDFRHDGDFFFGGPFGYDYPYYGVTTTMTATIPMHKLPSRPLLPCRMS
jgi:hypothetical protein